MNKTIFTYKAEGKFGESITLSLEKNGNITVSVYGPPRVDGAYVEPGEFVSVELPDSQAEGLINALWDVGPH
jgi:hypothetical protein